jgi:hypothetical protein
VSGGIPELVRIVDTPDVSAVGIHEPAARLLLLIQVLGDVDLPPDAADILCEALISVGAESAGAPSMAERVLDHPMWEPATWVQGPDCRRNEGFGGILECLSIDSPRFHARLAQGITREQNERLARALGTWRD